VAQLAVERDLPAAAISRAARAAQARPNLPVAEAVALAEQGVVPEPLVAPKPANPARLPRPPRAEADDDADFWGPEDQAEDSAAGEATGAAPRGRERGPAAPTTADGHRRFRIRTLSAFCDEVDRLARCLQEGDLAQAVEREADAAVRLRLASRQLDYVQRELAALCARHGWTDDPPPSP